MVMKKMRKECNREKVIHVHDPHLFLILAYHNHANEHARLLLFSPLDPFSITLPSLLVYGKATEYFSKVPV